MSNDYRCQLRATSFGRQYAILKFLGIVTIFFSCISQQNANDTLNYYQEFFF
jgi:hypothetical protein